MVKPNLLKELVAQLSAEIPAHLQSLKKDFEKICPNILTKTFAKFDLVTREEFDTQTKVLARTRKKLDELEKYVKELELMLQHKKSSKRHE